MATLTGQTIADSYEQLLSLPNGGGDNTTLVALTDGDAGTTFALKIATTSISINAAAKLYFDGGTHTYIQQSSADILDIYVGGVNMMKFTESAYPFVNVTGNVYIGSDGAGNSLVLYGTDTNSHIQLNVLPQIGVRNQSCGGANKSSLLFDSGANVAGDAMSIDWNMSSSYLGANPSVQIKGTRGSASHSGILTLSTRGSSGYAPVITCTEAHKVGIGNEDPETTLDIESGASSSGPATSGTTQTSGAILRLKGSDGGVCDFGIQSGGNGLWIQSQNSGALGTEYPIRLNENGGKVGIGTANPAYTLEVEDTSASCFIQVSSGASNSAGIKYASAGTMKWQMYNSSSASHDMVIQDADGDNGSKMDQNDTNWESSSDERMKQDLVELSGALDKLNTLRCVNYKMKHDALKGLDKTRLGLIAQDVYKVYPEATSGDPSVAYSYNSDVEIPEFTGRHTNAMGLKYTDMIAPMIKAIQELSEANDALKIRIEALEA